MGESTHSSSTKIKRVAEFHTPLDLGEAKWNATWGEPMLSHKSKHSNYSPPQGHVGDVNSSRRTSQNTTGLFSLNPIAGKLGRNRAIGLPRYRWEKIYQS